MARTSLPTHSRQRNCRRTEPASPLYRPCGRICSQSERCEDFDLPDSVFGWFWSESIPSGYPRMVWESAEKGDKKMTCGLGIVEAKTVLLAADSAAASLKNPEIYNLKTAKVFKVGSYGNGLKICGPRHRRREISN